MHIFFKLQFSHFGFLLVQIYLPNKTICEFILFHVFLSKYFFNFCSVFNTSSFLVVIPNLFETLNTWVSTANDGSSNNCSKTTLAVFLPTPLKLSKYSLSFGTYPILDIFSTISLKRHRYHQRQRYRFSLLPRFWFS